MNALQRGVEVTRIMKRPESVLTFERAAELVERHGSPLLVFSETEFRKNCKAMREGMPGARLHYAMKANSENEVLRVVRDEGLLVDVCSYEEAKRASVAGFSEHCMLNTNPCKSESDLQGCLGLGVSHFVFDCESEAEKTSRQWPGLKCLLRVAVKSKHSVIDLSSKYGCEPEEAADLVKFARTRGICVTGLSFHVGSQCTSDGDFDAALQDMRRIWDLIPDLKELNVGGGFPAPYREPVMSLSSYCRNVKEHIDRWFAGVDMQLLAEPGRGLVATSCTLITRVIGKKRKGGVWWYVIDDGLYGSFSGKVYDHADYALLTDKWEGLGECVVCGPTCDSSDIVGKYRLPELDIGDLILVPTMGAYTSVSATDFHGFPRAKFVKIQ